MTILGTVASSYRVPAIGTQTYNSIASVTLTATSSSVSFTNIPQTYKHLVLRSHYIGNGTYDVSAQFAFNSDQTTSYNTTLLIGNGQTNGSYNGAFIYAVNNETKANGGGWGSSTSTLWPASAETIILDYTSTSYYKSTIGFSGNSNPNDQQGTINTVNNVWKNTAAITSITYVFTYYGGTTTVGAYSQFSLYGLD